MDRIEALKNGLGDSVKEATEEISVTANLPHSIQQEFMGKKHPVMKLAGHIIDDVIDAIDDTTGSKWGERKLDHQFYRDFTITHEGVLVPLDLPHAEEYRNPYNGTFTSWAIVRMYWAPSA